MTANDLKTRISLFSICLVVAGISFTGCKKEENNPAVMPIPAVRPDINFYGLTDDNRILKYNVKTAETPTATVTISGLQTAEKLLSIDFRPATGQLYALGNSSRIYTINLNSGVATAAGTAAFTPSISGTLANIDFNPTVDRIRLVTNTGQNLRLNPETGLVAATDASINGGASPSITSIAYSNNIAGTATTELFDIDVTTKKLYKQLPPNDGTLVEVGALGVQFTGRGGFDINADNTAALATFNVGSVTKLYGVNLSTAATTFYADFSIPLIDIAVNTSAVAYTVNAANMLQIFNPTTVGTIVSKAITGLGMGETILGIDFRPATGQLFGLATTTAGAAKLYTFNLSSGAATAVGTGFMLATGVTGIGFDFNPTVDRIRVVTNTGQNLRLNPNDGTIAATDMNLNPGTPAITGAAYTNNFAGTTSTALLVLDATTLYTQAPPNVGTLTPVGMLGITNAVQNGFDIGGSSNNAFALFTVGTTTKIYSINITTGAATAGIDFPNAANGLAIGLGF